AVASNSRKATAGTALNVASSCKHRHHKAVAISRSLHGVMRTETVLRDLAEASPTVAIIRLVF
ncbi:MAG: hypothetical protein ACI8Z5_001480, partial [Lentimonas sp.]